MLLPGCYIGINGADPEWKEDRRNTSSLSVRDSRINDIDFALGTRCDHGHKSTHAVRGPSYCDGATRSADGSVVDLTPDVIAGCNAGYESDD